MPDSTDSRWSVELYNRHFDRPLARSLPFALVTTLFLLTLAREAWIVAAHWPASPPGGTILFGTAILLTPLMWLKGVLQHRQQRAAAARLREPSHRGLSIGGAMAYDYLYAATVGYLVFGVVLSLVPR